MRRLVLYHDFASAFCRVALPAAREASAAAGVDLELVPFELFPLPTPLPPAGEALAAELELMGRHAADAGHGMVCPPRTPRTRKAHEAVVHAAAAGLELAMAEALYEAVWHRGLDIGRLDVLGEVGEAVGLDGAALHVALGVDAHEAEVERAQRRAEAAGVEGVPTLRFGGASLVGLVAATEVADWLSSLRE